MQACETTLNNGQHQGDILTLSPDRRSQPAPAHSAAMSAFVSYPRKIFWRVHMVRTASLAVCLTAAPS